MCEIQRDPGLVRIVGPPVERTVGMRLVVKKWLHPAHRRSARRLDLDYVCAQIAKNLAAQKAPLGRQIQYAARTQHDAIYAPCLLNFTRPLIGYSYGHPHAGLSHAGLSHPRLSHATLSNANLPPLT